LIGFKLGVVVRKDDNPNDLKRYTLVRQAVETDFATIGDVIAELKRVKP
jgi:hypothetical protein